MRRDSDEELNEENWQLDAAAQKTVIKRRIHEDLDEVLAEVKRRGEDIPFVLNDVLEAYHTNHKGSGDLGWILGDWWYAPEQWGSFTQLPYNAIEVKSQHPTHNHVILSSRFNLRPVIEIKPRGGPSIVQFSRCESCEAYSTDITVLSCRFKYCGFLPEKGLYCGACVIERTLECSACSKRGCSCRFNG